MDEYPNTISIPPSTIHVNLANPVLTQTVNNQDSGALTVNVNDPLTLIITAKNNGPDTATNIQIKDKIPSELHIFDVTPSIGTYDADTGIWTIPELDVTGTATLTITASAGSDMAGQTITNTATEIGQTEYNPNPGTTTSIPIYTKLADVIFGSIRK